MDNLKLFAVSLDEPRSGTANFQKSATGVLEPNRESQVHSELNWEAQRIWGLLTPVCSKVRTVVLRNTQDTGCRRLCIDVITSSVKERVDTASQVLGNIESLPFCDESVHTIICANPMSDWDPIVTIGEFGRVLVPGGYLLVEFASSSNAALIGQAAFGQSVAIAPCSTDGSEAAPWAYSMKYIHNVVRAANLEIVRCVSIQVLAPWKRFIPCSGFSTSLRRFDAWARNLRILNRWAASQLLVCQKSA